MIEHAVSGATMQEACATELRQRMVAAGQAEQGAELLVQGFLMGIGDVSDTLVGRLDEWQAQYGERSTCDYPALHGAVLGLLYGADPNWKPRIGAAVRGYLQSTPGMLMQSASFLQGLFCTARDLLLVDPEFLSQIDRLLCALEDDDFTRLLPELRLAFSCFVPTETDRLAKRAAALHGRTGHDLGRRTVDPAAYTQAETLDAWAAARLDAFIDTAEGGKSEC